MELWGTFYPCRLPVMATSLVLNGIECINFGAFNTIQEMVKTKP